MLENNNKHTAIVSYLQRIAPEIAMEILFVALQQQKDWNVMLARAPKSW
jgi:hypothetical protein